MIPNSDIGSSMIKIKGAATAMVLNPRHERSEADMNFSHPTLQEKLLAAKNLDQVWICAAC
jgi:hypothetical protein